MSDHVVNARTLRFLRLTQFIVRQYTHLYHGIRITGREHVPLSGGVILASNHQSHLDPTVLGGFSPRPIHFLAKEELFRTPVLKTIMTLMAMVPTPRDGGASAALRAGVRILKGGHALGVFPEGTRSRTGERQPAHAGIVALAVLGGGVPIVPVYISGSRHAMPPGRSIPKFRHPLRIQFGAPIFLTPSESNLKDKEGMRLTAERIMDSIFEMKPDSDRSPKHVASETL